MYLFQKKLQHLSEDSNLTMLTYAVSLSVSALLYWFRAIRRPIPNAILSFIFVTITNSIQMGFFSIAAKNIMVSINLIKLQYEAVVS